MVIVFWLGYGYFAGYSVHQSKRDCSMYNRYTSCDEIVQLHIIFIVLQKNELNVNYIRTIVPKWDIVNYLKGNEVNFPKTILLLNYSYVNYLQHTLHYHRIPHL